MSDYTIEKATVGILKQEEIDVVRMPRARFLELVDELLEGDYPELREKLWPVAEAMTSFPLGHWIHKDRGCGCVVGEYLVATSDLSREELARLSGTDDLEVYELLGENMEDVGNTIDEMIEGELGLATWPGERPDAVLIEDDPS